MITGSCLCGSVRFEIEGGLSDPIACHCSMCRKISGHYWASTEMKRDRLKLEGTESLVWYQSSEKVKRGFCKNCGCALFFDAIKTSWIAVAMGALDKPSQIQLSKHIFVADKGDYYDITDGLPQEMVPPC